MTKHARRAAQKPIEPTGFGGGVWRLARSLLLMALYMLVLAIGVVPITLLNVRWLGLIAGVLIWLIGSAVMATYAADAFDGWGFVCAAVPMMLVTYVLPDYAVLRATTTVPVKTVADLQPPYAGRAFDFDRANIRPQYSGTYTSVTRSKSGGTTRRNYIVAPLTAPGWEPDLPVLAWVGCNNSYVTACDEWALRYHVGVLASEWDQADLRTAVEDAVKDHHLMTSPDAPIFKWSKSVQAEADSALNVIVFGSLFAYGMWAVPKIVVTAWHGLNSLWRK